MFKCTNYNFHSFEHKVAVNCGAAGQGCRIVLGAWQQKICVWQKIA